MEGMLRTEMAPTTVSESSRGRRLRGEVIKFRTGAAVTVLRQLGHGRYEVLINHDPGGWHPQGSTLNVDDGFLSSGTTIVWGV